MKRGGIQILLIVIGLIFINPGISAQVNDSLQKPDSTFIPDSSLPLNRKTSLDSFLIKNNLANITATPVSLAVIEKNKTGKEFLFYLLAIVVLIIAIFKVFYNRYFNNIFRVFFNTSLRQNQLTDLLLQAKLPSLIFNIFFVITAGLYTWLVFKYYGLVHNSSSYVFIGLSILVVALIYIGKFISLKLIGWITGMMGAADQYIFIIFLINKITGIFLLPFIILLAFAPPGWLSYIIISSFVVIGILFLLRYLRSYGLLQNQLKINRFHFLVYIIGMEVLPILLIYKFITVLVF